MDWEKWTEALLKTLLLFGIVLLWSWFFECVILKEKLNLIVVALNYMLTDTTFRYYENKA